MNVAMIYLQLLKENLDGYKIILNIINNILNI